ncbi:MAG: hypothetical protein H0W65_11930 [Sphingomonas sp.]|uniref:hypothetical protein n=1 Tax=Sphingomonas sp. TaxID=28214 RepID=UPI0017E9CDD3|nr:hypothetical protein [Sphingomonas sp.]MBA3668406.1 hypothetical protein [Sphingomonas sp.]
MQSVRRPTAAISASRFGRGRRYTMAVAAAPDRTLSDDVKLFALTFVGGFLFMGVYLA